MPQGSLPETIYEPNLNLGLGWDVWREMACNLRRSTGLGLRLFQRDLAAAYRQSFLGTLWILVPPVLTTGLFAALHGSHILRFGETPLPYPAYVMLGTTLWFCFSGTVRAASNVFSTGGALINRVHCHREGLVLSGTLQALFQTILRGALTGLVLWGYGVRPGLHWLLAPLLVAPMVLLALGIGLLLAPLQGVVRDTGKVVDIALRYGLFAAPVVYPVPTAWPQSLLVYLNPFTPFLLALQDCLAVRDLTWSGAYGLACVASSLVFVVGWRAFYVLGPRAVERI